MIHSIPTRRVGSTGRELSELGFGAAPLGNLFRELSDQDALLAVRAARRAGISYFDTAPYYGFGLSERRLGDALRFESRPVVSTKVGRLLQPLTSTTECFERDGFRAPLAFEAKFDYSYSGVMHSWESSLDRLGVGGVEILFVHDIGAMTHAEHAAEMFSALTSGGGFRALEELRAKGSIAAYGLGVNEWQVCMQAMRYTRPDIFLLAGRYTLLEQGAMDVFLPTCIERGIAVVAGGVYNSGILATGTRGAAVPYYNYAHASAAVMERVARIEDVCESHGVPLSAVALQFSLAHPAIASVVLGLADEVQVEAALRAYRTAIPAALWQTLKTRGVLREDAPVPDAGK